VIGGGVHGGNFVASGTAVKRIAVILGMQMHYIAIQPSLPCDHAGIEYRASSFPAGSGPSDAQLIVGTDVAAPLTLS
jgi:hypothetical protein